MDNSRIAELSSIIAKNTEKISAALRKHSLSPPSFDLKGPPMFPNLPSSDIDKLRFEVIAASEELRALMLGPLEYVLSFDSARLLSVQAISRFDIVKHIPVAEEVTFSELAFRSGLPEGLVKRLLRHAITLFVFQEPRPGVIAHNAISKTLAEDGSLSDWLWANTNIMWQSAAHTVDAVAEFKGSEKENQTGFNVATGYDKPFYAYLQENLDKARRFGGAMSLYARNPATSVQHMVEGYPWADLGKASIIDVGGSHGDFSKAMVPRFPDLKFVNQDLPSVIETAPEMTDVESARIQMMSHDFFTPQPLRDVDAIFLRQIFHNNNDENSIRILQCLTPALRPGSRIIVAESMLPAHKTVRTIEEQRLRSQDLAMLWLFNAKKRDVDDWKTLFGQADVRFKFNKLYVPEGSDMSMVEFIWT